MLLFELSKSKIWTKVRKGQVPIHSLMCNTSFLEGSTNLVNPAVCQRQGAEILFIGHVGWFERTRGSGDLFTLQRKTRAGSRVIIVGMTVVRWAT